jgi:hypothetical protein
MTIVDSLGPSRLSRDRAIRSHLWCHCCPLSLPACPRGAAEQAGAILAPRFRLRLAPWITYGPRPAHVPRWRGRRSASGVAPRWRGRFAESGVASLRSGSALPASRGYSEQCATSTEVNVHRQKTRSSPPLEEVPEGLRLADVFHHVLIVRCVFPDQHSPLNPNTWFCVCSSWKESYRCLST